ncbi:hypothetical protein F2Q68_00044122 [Brassica cretica]|uniref:Uncharacterized protein n=1 Tax=Brassica cretica TaxID=69181 RepID=A0A8S9LJC4_BRACR|nr:hypothetical protein F2Q68_00044122 [Brassica cretica]
MNFPNRRFSSPSICEYQTSKGDSGPKKKRPEPKLILHKPKVFPQSTSCPNQNHCKDHGLIVSTHHENVLNPKISKQKQIFTWLKNVLLKPFHELFSLSCVLKEIWFRKRRETKLLRPKNQFDFIDDENFSKLALAHSFPNSFTVWPDFEIDKPIFGNHFTFLMFAHVLDDYPKSLDRVFDILRKEKPFDYFFRRFDVVSLVVLKVQDIKDQFQMEASRGGRHHTCVLGTWNWKYLRETSSKLQGSKMDLRTNPFEEGEYDTPWIEHRPVWFMDTAQGGVLVYQLDQTIYSQDRPNRRCNEPFKSSQGEADPKRRFLQFDVQEICDNFEKGMMKAIKDISKNQKKSTSTRAPVAEHPYSSARNPNTIVELTVLQPEHPSSLVLSQQVFEEDPMDYPHQGPRLDTIKPLDDDLGPIFDEEDEPGPVFDEEPTSITSIVMESHLSFDPGTTPAPLSFELQEHLFVLSIQEREVQLLGNESTDRAQHPEIWRCFVI